MPEIWRLPVPLVSSAFVADPELIAELENIAESAPVGADRVLFRQGDAPTGVYIVRKGTATLTSGTNGVKIMKFYAGEGSLLGVPAVVGGKLYSLTAEASPDAEIGVVTCEDFLHLMHTEPLLAFRVLQVLAEEVRSAREASLDRAMGMIQ
jgi:CRP-like cAMP-binding protein